MKVQTAAFAAGIGTVRQQLGSMASNIGAAQVALVGLGAAASVAFYKLATSASNVEEQTDRVRDQFGRVSQKVIDFSNTIATAYGITKTFTLESSSSFAALFEGAGYADDAVADLSIHFVKLGTDISRFVNMPVKEALLKLKSGLAGESAAIRELGVSMLEEDVAAYAYAKGIAKVNAELTSSQKVQARVGYLTERFAKAQGNLAKTGDKFAGAMEAFYGRIENLSAAIGKSLLAIAIPAESQILFQYLETSWTKVADAALASSSASIEGLVAENHSIGILQQSIGYIADAWQGVGIVIKSVQLIMLGSVREMIAAFKTVNDTYIALANLLPGKKIQSNGAIEKQLEVATVATQLAQNNLNDLLKAKPAHEGVNAGFEQARKDIRDARNKLKAEGNLDVNKIKPTAATATVKGKEHKGFAHAAVLGSDEATNAILQNAFGMPGQKNGAAEKTAKNTEKTNVLLEGIMRRLGGNNAGNQRVAGAILDAF